MEGVFIRRLDFGEGGGSRRRPPPRGMWLTYQGRGGRNLVQEKRSRVQVDIAPGTGGKKELGVERPVENVGGSGGRNEKAFPK